MKEYSFTGLLATNCFSENGNSGNTRSYSLILQHINYKNSIFFFLKVNLNTLYSQISFLIFLSHQFLFLCFSELFFLQIKCTFTTQNNPTTFMKQQILTEIFKCSSNEIIPIKYSESSIQILALF